MLTFNMGDNVYACPTVTNQISINQTDNSARIHRGVINNLGQWQVNDTIIISDLNYIFFGYQNARDLEDPVKITDQNGNILNTVTTGQGTNQIIITLKESGPNNENLVIYYRCGIPAIYNRINKDRQSKHLNCHTVTLVGSHSWMDVYNQSKNPILVGKGTAQLKAHQTTDGLSLQTNPPQNLQ